MKVFEVAVSQFDEGVTSKKRKSILMLSTCLNTLTTFLGHLTTSSLVQIVKPEGSTTAKSALAITNSNLQAENLVSAFEILDSELAYTNYADLALSSLIETPDSWGFLILSLEKFDTTEKILDFVSQVCCINPRLPILLLSRDAKKSNVTLKRTRLGDAVIGGCSNPKKFAETIATLMIPNKTCEVLSAKFEPASTEMFELSSLSKAS
ncbi:hypothetical protein RB2150_00310 [Rhodobacterales bacterium HTCC2150]|nr:hypothetical protein RB2150_00310 [Rhodobacterales bacterium HTCC2150] [Rhodobacteraceae bacterium HTCC2150]